jgi:hypothetical protein
MARGTTYVVSTEPIFLTWVSLKIDLTFYLAENRSYLRRSLPARHLSDPNLFPSGIAPRPRTGGLAHPSVWMGFQTGVNVKNNFAKTLAKF